MANLDEDIQSIQVAGGYAYGTTYGVFVLFCFLAAVYAERKYIGYSSFNYSDCYHVTRKVGKTIIRIKGIYFIIFVHIFDTITDFLIILEWYIKGTYEQDESNNIDFPNINYYGCFMLSIFILLFYRILSAHYIFNYYKQSQLYAIFHAILQFADLSLFYEVYQSHLHKSATDNLSYISKLEKTFESSPQLILQLYVLMRELSQNQQISAITIISIFFSLISLSTKVISDDSTMFISKANKSTNISFYLRCTFRITEISSRLLSITLVAVYFGANF
eukprot:101142_1